jgi:hypothetical protein
MSAHHFHAKPVGTVDLAGTDATLVRFADGEGPAAWGFHHECGRWADDREPDGEFVKVVAPRLTNHTVTVTDAGVTVRASILCPDCGRHGFVTDSVWT